MNFAVGGILWYRNLSFPGCQKQTKNRDETEIALLTCLRHIPVITIDLSLFRGQYLSLHVRLFAL